MWDYLLNATVTLLVTVDPIALAPIFIALTHGRTAVEQRRIALLACIIAGLILLGASFLGSAFLGLLGISLAAFRVAGGMLLFIIAVEMLFDLRARRKSAQADPNPDHEEAIAAFPLAIPMMAGPAAISASILTGARAPDTVSAIGLGVVIAAIMAICFGVFLISDPIARFLRRTGRIVVTRLFGLVLAALSVQFVADGVRELATAP